MTVVLRPYQESALKRMEGREGFALFHDTGTGKTLTTLRDMERAFDTGRATRALVVAPLSALHNWRDQMAEFTPYAPLAVRGSLRARQRIIEGDHKVLLMNYDLVPRHADALAAAGLDYLAADESHQMASPKVAWTKALLRLAKHANVRRVLSGSPIRKWELDLYNQMMFIDPNILGKWRSHFAFKKAFAIEQNMGSFSSVIGMRNVEVIRELCAPYADYLSFDNAMPHMPPWVEERRLVPMSAEQLRLYKELRRDLMASIDSGEVTAANAAIEALRLSQIAGGTLRDTEGRDHRIPNGKLEETKDIVSNHRGKGGIVVWVRFTEEARWLSEELSAPCIYGDTPEGRRTHHLKEFEAGRLPVIVCLLQTMSESVNELCNADLEIRWSYDWSYVTFKQSRARMRRGGRNPSKPCLSIQLVTENSTDLVAIDAVRRKENVSVGTLEAIRSLVAFGGR